MLGPDPLFTRRVLLVGKPGTGKSAKMLALLRDEARVVLFDTQGRYSQPQAFDSYIVGLLSGFDFLSAADLEEYLRARLALPSFRCVVSTPYNRAAWFERCCRLVTGAGRIAFGVDEARLLCPTTKITPQFSRIVNYRGDQVTLYANTQRPAQVHNDLTAAVTDWFVFQVTNKNDLARLDAEGVPVYENGVQGLPSWGFLYYCHDGAFHLDLSAGKG